MFIRKSKMQDMVKGIVDETIVERLNDFKYRNTSDVNFRSLEMKAWFEGREALINLYKYNFPKSIATRGLVETYFWRNVDLLEEVPISIGFPRFLSNTLAKILYHNGIKVGKEGTKEEKWEVDNDFTDLMIAIATTGSYSNGTFVELFTDGSYNVLDNTEAEYCCNTKDIVVREDFVERGKAYQLVKTYCYGATTRELYSIGTESKRKKAKAIPLTMTAYTFDMEEVVQFNDNVIQCVYIPTKSVYEGNIDLFNSLDESFSIINEVNRKSKPIEYLNSSHMPVDKHGRPMHKMKRRKRSFEVLEGSTSEGAKNEITFNQPDFTILNYQAQYDMARKNILESFGISALSVAGDEVANVSLETRLIQESSTIRTREELLRFYDRFMEMIYYQWQASIKLGEGKTIASMESESFAFIVNDYMTEPKITNQKAIDLYNDGIIERNEVREILGFEPLEEEVEEDIDFEETDEEDLEDEDKE